MAVITSLQSGQCLNFMENAGHRMARLTDQLLAYAQGGKYQTKRLGFNDFLMETIPIVKHSLKPTVRLETVLPKDVSSVEADPTQIQMLLSAVLSNANDAIEGEGLVRITTKNQDISDSVTGPFDCKPGRYVSLTIEDNGKGMDEKTKSAIFEPFFTTKFQGRGMGMAAVYGVVRNHGGHIHVDSDPGNGTVVRIFLPALPEETEKKTNSGDG